MAYRLIWISTAHLRDTLTLRVYRPEQHPRRVSSDYLYRKMALLAKLCIIGTDRYAASGEAVAIRH